MPRGKEDMELNMSLDGNKLEQVKEFVYLGSQITEDATNDQDAKRRSRVWSSVISWGCWAEHRDPGIYN